MSIRVMDWVWRESRSRGAERLVLLAIADCANDEGEHAYPSIATLATKGGISESTVHRAIDALVALGELRVTRNAGKRGTNLYAVIRDGGVRMTPGGCQDETPGGVNVTPEPSVEPSENQNPSLRSGTAGAVATVESVNAGQIIKAYCDRLPARPPGRVLAQLGRYIKELLDEGIPPRCIWAGLVVWHDRRAQPATLASFVNDQMNRGALPPEPKMSTTERRAAEAVAAGQRVEALWREQGILT